MFDSNICKIPDSLLSLGIKKSFPKGSSIYKINKEIANCYFILSGMLKIYIDHENGRRSILDFAGKYDWLGELSLFCVEKDIKENKILEEITCIEYDLNSLRKICKEDAEISYYFATYTANKLLMRSYRMSEYMNYSLEKRLASFILKYHNDRKYNIPHTDVSEYMNVSYRHLLFVIKKFCEDGLLEKEKGYIITDFNKLKEISNNIK